MDEELNVTAAQPGGTAAAEAGEQKVHAAHLDSVTANTVTMTDSQVNQLQAVDVQMSRGGAGRVQAANIQVTEGGIGMAQGQAVGVSNGGVGFMVAREVTVTDGSVAFMAALRLDGNPKIGFDMRAGAIMGLVFGIVVGLFQLLRNRGKCCE